MAQKRGELQCPFREGELGPRLTQCGLGPAEVYFRTKWRLHPFSRLATSIDMGQKLGLCPSLWEELGPHRTQRRLGRGLLPYQVAS